MASELHGIRTKKVKRIKFFCEVELATKSNKYLLSMKYEREGYVWLLKCHTTDSSIEATKEVDK